MTPKDDFASLMEASLARRRLKVGEVVEGTVIQIGADSVFLDVGAAADARIDRADVLDTAGELRVKIGDRLRATVVDASPDAPRLALSIGRGGQVDSAALEVALTSGTPVEGRVLRAVKGGLEVELGGARAFCPASQVELGHANDLAVYEGQTLAFKLMELKDGGRSVIVSRRAVLEVERRERASEIEQHLVPGSDVEGVVHSVTKHGAVVDLGGVEGFVHISELVHHRVERVEDVLRQGESVRVRVLAVEQSPKGMRVRLSMKALTQPVAAAAPAPDEVLKGKVARVAAFGVFVETSKGEGLVPVRELGLPPGADHRRAFPVGTEMEVVLLSRDAQSGKQRFSVRGVAGVEERKNYQEFAGASAPRGGLGTFGDLLRKQLGLPEPPPEPVVQPEPPRPAPPAPAPITQPEPRAARTEPPRAVQAPPPATAASEPRRAEPAAPAKARVDPPGVVRRRKP